MQDFRKLRVWHCAQELALNVIHALPELRSRRVPGLRAQAIRAATSVPANLAEGCARSTRSQLLQFVEIAITSLNELETHLQLAREAGIVDSSRYVHLCEDLILTRKMCIAFTRTLRRKIQEDTETHDAVDSVTQSARNAVDSTTQ